MNKKQSKKIATLIASQLILLSDFGGDVDEKIIHEMEAIANSLARRYKLEFTNLPLTPDKIIEDVLGGKL